MGHAIKSAIHAHAQQSSKRPRARPDLAIKRRGELVDGRAIIVQTVKKLYHGTEQTPDLRPARRSHRKMFFANFTSHALIARAALANPQVLAVILLILGAATIGIINSNDGLKFIRDAPGTYINFLPFKKSCQPLPSHLPEFSTNEETRELQALIVSTNGAAVWQIVLSIGVIISVSVSMVLSVVIVAGNGKLIVAIVVSAINVAIKLPC